jgi:hypothetical protein
MNVRPEPSAACRVDLVWVPSRLPHELMMFSSESEGKPTAQDIYIGLPEESLLSGLPGFKEIQRDELPDFMATLIAREDGFKERFPDIAAKRRTKYGR